MDKQLATCGWYTVDEEEGKELLIKSNPKVPDFLYTGTKHQCNKDWDVR